MKKMGTTWGGGRVWGEVQEDLEKICGGGGEDDGNNMKKTEKISVDGDDGNDVRVG